MVKNILDLENHFAIYRAYHKNPMNIMIHNIFVWPIFFNSLILFYFTPPLFQLPFFGGLDINFAFLAILFYSLFCIALDNKAGSLAALLCLLCWFGSQLLAASLGFSLAWKVVLASLLLSWMGQSIGHGVFEKRAPALLDNISLAFLMAPFFVLLEDLLSKPLSFLLIQALTSSFGYEPHPGFNAHVHARIEADLKEWEASKMKKTS